MVEIISLVYFKEDFHCDSGSVLKSKLNLKTKTMKFIKVWYLEPNPKAINVNLSDIGEWKITKKG